MTRLTPALAALVALSLAATPSAAPVLTPGSPGGPTAFGPADGPQDATCAPDVPYVGDHLCAAVPGGAADRLRAGTFTLNPFGLGRTNFQARVTRHNDFSVAASPDGRDTPVVAHVASEVDVMGGLAAAMEATSTVEVRLTLLDITGGGGRVVASKVLFSDQAVGYVSPGISVTPGVLLPVPDGSLSVGVGIGYVAQKKLVDTDAAGGFDAIVQRGHDYRLQVELLTTADIGAGSGFAVSSFAGGGLAPQLDRLPDLVDPDMWTEHLESLLQLPELDFDAAVFSNRLSIPPVDDFVTFPGFNSGNVTAFPGFHRSFETFPGFSFHLGLPALPDVNFSIPSHSISVNIPSQSFSISIPRFEVDIPGHEIDLPVAGLLTSVDDLLDDVGLPRFGQSLDFSTVVDWLVRVSPEAEMLLDEAGVQVRALSVVLSDDLHLQANDNRDLVMSNDDANRTAILVDAAANRAAVMANDDENTQTILDALENLFDDDRRRDIANNLGDRQCEPWMYTPAFADTAGTIPLGGRLELVLDVVQKAIDDARTLGSVSDRDLDRAQAELDGVVALLAERPPLDAHDVCGGLVAAWERVAVQTY